MKYTPYSYSKIRTFLDCPRKFYFHYVKNLKQEASEILEKGSIAHEILEEYTKRCMQVKQATDIAFLEKDIYIAITDKYPKYLEWIGKFISQARNLVFDWENIIDVESEIVIDEKGGVLDDWWDKKAYARAKRDLRYVLPDGTPVFRDWKSGFKFDIDEFQLEFYAWLEWEENKLIDRVFGEYYFINEINNYCAPMIEITDFKDIKKKIQKVISEIEAEEKFEPQPKDGVCLYCPFIRNCHEMGIAKGEIQIIEKFLLDTPEKASQAATMYQRLKAFVNSLDELLKEYASGHGAIVMPDGEYKFIEKEKKEIKDEAILSDKLISVGLNPIDYMSFTMTKLNGALKKHECISDCLEYSKTQAFTFVKTKKENKKDNKKEIVEALS